MARTIRVLLLALLVTFLWPVQAAERVVRIANGEWPPYLGEHLPHYGLASRIVTEAFKLQGITVQYGFFPWRRAYLISSTAVDWDGTAVWARSDEREQQFYYSDPVIESDTVFFHLKTTMFAWNDIEDLFSYNIGVTGGYFYHPEFANAIKQGKLPAQVAPSDEQNLRKLLAGRIDAFPVDRVVGLTMLREHFSPAEAQRLIFHPKRLNVEQMHLLLGKHKPENRKLIEEFNKGLKKLKESGRIEAFTKEALGSDGRT